MILIAWRRGASRRAEGNLQTNSAAGAVAFTVDATRPTLACHRCDEVERTTGRKSSHRLVSSCRQRPATSAGASRNRAPAGSNCHTTTGTGRGILQASAGALYVDVATNVPNLVISLGTLTGEADLTVTSAMNWSGGTMSGGGRTFIAPRASLTIRDFSNGHNLRRTLQNDGIASWQSGDISKNGGQLFFCGLKPCSAKGFDHHSVVADSSVEQRFLQGRLRLPFGYINHC